MSRKPLNTARTDKLFNTGRGEEGRRDENRRFFLQVIQDFDGRVGNKLCNLRARLNESWEKEESSASSQSQDYLEEEFQRLRVGVENQRCPEQKVTRPKKPPHKRVLRYVSKRLEKLKNSVVQIAGRSPESSTEDSADYRRDARTHSAYYCKMSTPSLLQWSVEQPGIFSVQETQETEYDHSKGREDTYSVGVAKGRRQSPPPPQKLKFRCRTKSEIKTDPEFSMHLLKWPPAESTLKAAPKKSGPVREHAQRWERRDVSIAGMSSTRKLPQLNFKTRTVSEIKSDPHFSHFLLKWPPECSALKPVPKQRGSNKYSDSWEKDIKNSHKPVGRFDPRKVRVSSPKPRDRLTQATHEEAGSRDVGRLRILSQPQTQQKLLGGSRVPDSCEHFMPRYTLKSAVDTSEESWESESQERPEGLSLFRSQKSGIQHRAAEVSKNLEKVTTAKRYWMNHIKELESEAKSLEKELEEIDNKIKPRRPTVVLHGKGIHTKKFRRKLKRH